MWEGGQRCCCLSWGVGVGLQVIRTCTNEVFPITPGTSSRSSLTFLCFLLFFFWENCNSLRNSGLRRSGLRRSRRRFEELL